MSDDRARRLAQLRQAYESGILDEDTYKTAVVAFSEPAKTQATVIGTGASAQQGGAAAGAGGVAIVGNVQGGVYVGPPAKNPTEALAIYRRVITNICGHLPLRGIDIGAADAAAGQKPLALANVYVDLDTTKQVELSEEVISHNRVVQSGKHETRPLGALEAVITNRRLVLLGDPGGGKSTFVNYLAYCLAMHALESQAKWLDHLPSWPEKEADALPVIIILRDFARNLPEKLSPSEPSHLWNFIGQWLKAKNLEFAAEPLQEALEQGKALVLLDGLDEVPTVTQRIFVRDAVTAFIERYPRNRYLITCRILSYQKPVQHHAPDPRLPHLPDFELAKFDEEKINRFIEAWYRELADKGVVVRSEDVSGLTRQLQDAVRRPDIWRLAPNPLLLTVIGLVHTHKGRLPDARALLYEDAVELLLWRWEQVKAGGQQEATGLRQLLLEANRTEADLKRMLWQLAFDVHVQGKDNDDQEKLAGIGELKLEKALAALKDDDRNWARQMIETMKLRAGLLLEREPEVFTFPHRTFQEYLAGAHLAAQGEFARQACRLAGQGSLWREAILLAVGRLVFLSGDTDKPLALAGELCPAQVNDNEVAWRKAWLAGDVLQEIGPNRVADSCLGRDLLSRLQTRLTGLITGGKLAPRERVSTGNTLARLGDLRFRADAWYLPAEPLLGFIEVPKGPFSMGSDPEHELDLPSYFIARYPVTVAQFRAFVEASGYKPWDEDRLSGLANHPVVNVTWYDALAYCDWLTETLKECEDTLEPLRGLLRSEDWRITLPSEAQWEKAARGSDGRIYPWGDDADPNRVNYGDTGINDTSAVGCFPNGVSPYSCLDMAGNTWEWTRSLWGKDWQKPDFNYPYDPQDGREDLSADRGVLRVLRGGAFGDDEAGLRCAFRLRHYPDLRGWYFGFRLVVSPL